jgi:hypothetical protein
LAGDLIPPPSPARRSDPEADTKATAELEEAVQLATEAAAPTGPSPFRSRFGFLFGVLAGIALCVAGGTALLLGAQEESGPKLAENWSAWEPETSRMVDGAEEIAGHVGLQYKLDSGDQLVSVRSSSLELQGEDIGVAVRPVGGSLQYMEGEGLLYILNGLGPNGTIPTGTASKKRGRLLLREALELALYSFRYLDDVTMVAVLLPQTTEQQAANAGGAAAAPETNAVFFRPGDLVDQLEVPLAQTLSPKTPRPSTMTKTESTRVDELTLRNLFLASVQPLEANQSYLVLAEPDTVE